MKTSFISCLILLVTSCVTSFASNNMSMTCNKDEEPADKTTTWKSKLGDVEVLRQHINAGVNIKDENGNTPLHLSLRLINPKFTEEILAKLINGEKNLNLPNNKGETPLHLVLFTKDHAHNAQTILDYLLTTKQDINLQDYLGDTPLHLALRCKYHICAPKILDYLIKNNKDINLQNKKGDTPLHLALRSKRHTHNAQTILNHLIVTKQDINLQDECDNTPLHLALGYKYHICAEKILDYLIENKKDINAPVQLFPSHQPIITYKIRLRYGYTQPLSNTTA